MWWIRSKCQWRLYHFQSLTSASKTQLQFDLFCKNTRIFVVNWSVLACRHKLHDFRHAFSSSARVDRGVIGRVWRKSSDNRIMTPPKMFWLSQISFNFLFSASSPIFSHSLKQFWHSNTTIIIFYVSLSISAVSTWRSSSHIWLASTT
jgi:hypothetical protein